MSTSEISAADDTPQEPGLTVDELCAQLTEISQAGGGTQKAYVPYKPGTPTIGPSAAMPVVKAATGFDWNRGRVFIQTAKILGDDDDSLERLRKKAQQLSNKHYLAQRVLKNDALTDSERVQALRKLFEPAPTVAAPTRVKAKR
jgi:hypothetical protein